MIQENHFFQPQLSDAGGSQVVLLSFLFLFILQVGAYQFLHVPSSSFMCLAVIHVPRSPSCAQQFLHVPSSPSCAQQSLHVPSNLVFFMCLVILIPSCVELLQQFLHVSSYSVYAECFFMCQVTQCMSSVSIWTLFLQADLQDLFCLRHLI